MVVTTFDVDALTSWLGAAQLDVLGSPSAGGWSNETVFLRVDRRRLVLRLGPAGSSMFPSYDLGCQVTCMEHARAAGLAVPEIVAADITGTILGRSCFVMDHLEGRVPADDDPPFTKTGFLFDAAPADQRHFSERAIDAIAGVHVVAAPGFLPVGPAPRHHVAWCADLADWAGLSHPALVRAHAELVASVPGDDDAPVGLLWGDARPANMVVDDRFEIVGLLDWELAGVGPGELDVAWFCEMNRMRSLGMGIAPLPGFLDDDATWRRWSSATGRDPIHVDWHHRFAAYRVAVLLFLFLGAAIRHGRLPADHRLLRENLATRRLDQLFDSR